MRRYGSDGIAVPTEARPGLNCMTPMASFSCCVHISQTSRPRPSADHANLGYEPEVTRSVTLRLAFTSRLAAGLLTRICDAQVRP